MATQLEVEQAFAQLSSEFARGEYAPVLAHAVSMGAAFAELSISGEKLTTDMERQVILGYLMVDYLAKHERVPTLDETKAVVAAAQERMRQLKS
jgi:hypothetical protein